MRAGLHHIAGGIQDLDESVNQYNRDEGFRDRSNVGVVRLKVTDEVQ